MHLIRASKPSQLLATPFCFLLIGNIIQHNNSSVKKMRTEVVESERTAKWNRVYLSGHDRDALSLTVLYTIEFMYFLI